MTRGKTVPWVSPGGEEGKEDREGRAPQPGLSPPGQWEPLNTRVASAGREGKGREAKEEAEHCAGSGWWQGAERETEEVAG